MGERYGAFPRIVTAVSCVLALYIAVLVLFSHPLGFLGSIIVLGLYGLLVKGIKWLYEPEFIRTPESPPMFVPPRKEMSVEEGAARIAAAVYNTGTPKSRVLGGPQDTVARSRLLNPVESRTSQTRSDPEAERRKEDAEWAEMFRAL